MVQIRRRFCIGTRFPESIIRRSILVCFALTILLWAARLDAQTPPDELDGILIPTDLETVISFGQRVAISGDTAVIGAPGFTGDGAAYVFAREPGVPGSWRQTATLRGPGRPLDFPTSVAISGDTIVVGATDVIQQLAGGAALVFQRDAGGPGAWGQVATLSVQGVPARGFGENVAISGDTIIVGASRVLSPSFGVAYVFSRNAGGANTWGEVAMLTGDAQSTSGFGSAIAVSGDTAAVGDPFHNGGNGAIYIFRREAGEWREATKLSPSGLGFMAGFGSHVDIRGDSLIAATDQESVSGETVFVYTSRPGAVDTWDEVFRQNFFAITRVSVAISTNVAVVGSSTDDGRADGSGAAHLITRDPAPARSWRVKSKVGAADGRTSDFFGYAVSADGSTLLIGAPNQVGVNGKAYVCQLGTEFAVTSPCGGSPFVVDNQLRVTHPAISCCDNEEMAITFTFTNVSTAAIGHPFIEVVELSGGNLLRNADNGPAGVGAILTPDVEDEVLSPQESVTVTFNISLASRGRFRFLVQVRGEPVR